MYAERITKLDAARRQLDTAIDLYFAEEGDKLSGYTLAFAALKLLVNIYPHQNNDGFSTQLDTIIGETGWRSISGTANFLKHADRDPEGVLDDFHPDRVQSVAGFATLLYRRLAGSFSRNMEAFDYWVEFIAADELGIVDNDENAARVRATAAMRKALNDAPWEVRMQHARTHYRAYLENRDRLIEEAEKARAEGLSLTEALDRLERTRAATAGSASSC